MSSFPLATASSSMDATAEMECVLKVNANCESCREKVMQILESIRGTYSITFDADGGTVRVAGEVRPRALMAVMAQASKHAEVSWVRIKGRPVMKPTEYYGSHPSYHHHHHHHHTSPPPPPPCCAHPPPPPDITCSIM